MRIGRNEKVYMLFAFKLTHYVFDRRQIGDREANLLILTETMKGLSNVRPRTTLNDRSRWRENSKYKLTICLPLVNGTVVVADWSAIQLIHMCKV